MKKIVFIINSAQNPLCIKRIDEFTDRGYKVTAYAFNRNIGIDIHPRDLKLNILGDISNNSSYVSRIKTIYRAISKVVRYHKAEDVIYYVFGLDIALFISLLTKKKYIYEESDLVHTYINNKTIRYLFDRLDKRLIKKALLTVLTSEGFARYHFNDNWPNNICIVTNRLQTSVLECPKYEKNYPQINKLKIGFVGGARFNSILYISNHILKNYPLFEIHFYGNPVAKFKEQFYQLSKYPNCFFHGPFVTPIDLPSIYSNIDLLLCTYDVEFENVKYAEPNKIYEAIFFETPILVSKGTFLAEKVERLDIGYSVDPLSADSIDSFVKKITVESLLEKSRNASKIDKMEAVNNNEVFFDRLKRIL